MSLSNISKDHLENLFLSLTSNNVNSLESVKKKYVEYYNKKWVNLIMLIWLLVLE